MFYAKEIDLYLPDHKLAIEIDEKRHIDRKKKKGKKKERKDKIEKGLGSEFITINPDSEKFNIHIEIGYTITLMN